MQATFQTNHLKNILATLASVVPSRTPKPVLQCIKIVAEKEHATLYATDLDIVLTCKMNEIEVTEPGEMVVPAANLCSIVNNAPDDCLEIKTNDEAGATITGADSEYTIYTYDPDKFPAMENEDADVNIEIDAKELRAGIKRTIYSAAKSSTRYALNGIHWQTGNGELVMTATDGRQLAVVKATADIKNPITPTILPLKAMAILNKMDTADVVNISIVENRAIFSTENMILSSCLIEGHFPDISSIIPKDTPHNITLNTGQTLRAIRRAAVLTTPDSDAIKIEYKAAEGVLKFTGRTPEVGTAEINLQAIGKGADDFMIALNCRYLTDMLKVIEADEVTFSITQSDRPAMFTVGNFTAVIMPINL